MDELVSVERDVFYDPHTEIGRRRLRSGESDFGVWWSIDRFPHYRVSVVHDTGEIVAVSMSDGGITVLRGTHEDEAARALFGPSHQDSECTDPDCPYARAERLLEGWAERIHEDDSLHWVAARLGLDLEPTITIGVGRQQQPQLHPVRRP